jgi:hypothetical protein
MSDFAAGSASDESRAIEEAHAMEACTPMANLNMQQIRERARTIVAANLGGIRFSALQEQIKQENPETNGNTISGSIYNLQELYPSEISKPTRGLFKPTSASGSEDSIVATGSEQPALADANIKEAEFYGPFADWLKNDLDEVTDVDSLGGASMKTKWGTPDVIGVYKPLAGNLIKFPLEIVSAEIKIDPYQPVVAFGQAVAYRLFSTKTYVAMPTTLTQEDQSRLESLCMLFGVGFVLFDLDKNNPRFSIRVRAQRFSPDMFYVNEFADRLRLHDAEVFERLFR